METLLTILNNAEPFAIALMAVGVLAGAIAMMNRSHSKSIENQNAVMMAMIQAQGRMVDAIGNNSESIKEASDAMRKEVREAGQASIAVREELAQTALKQIKHDFGTSQARTRRAISDEFKRMGESLARIETLMGTMHDANSDAKTHITSAISEAGKATAEAIRALNIKIENQKSKAPNPSMEGKT